MNDNTKMDETLPQPAAQWCILRTSPGRTLRLMASLGAADIEAWTPKQTQTRKRPRSRSTFEIETAIAPTFVFARASHLRALAAAEAMLVNPHPAFSIFRHAGRIPLIDDREVEGLRHAEERARVAVRRTKRRRLVMGQRVRITEGVGEGMSGVVEQSGDRFVLVAFGQSFTMRIATSLLSPDDIEQTQSVMGAAA